MNLRLQHRTKDPHVHVARYFSCSMGSVAPFATAIRVYGENESSVFATGHAVFEVKLKSKRVFVLCEYYSPCTIRVISAADADKLRKIEQFQRVNRKSFVHIQPTDKKGWVSKEFADMHGWKMFDQLSKCEFIMGVDGAYRDTLGRLICYKAGEPVRFPLHYHTPSVNEIAFFRHF